MNWSAFLALGILAASAHWLLARAKITAPFWGLNWLPEGQTRALLDGLLSCAACTGWWAGLGLGLLGLRPAVTGWGAVADVLLAGLLAVWATPVFEGLLMWGLERSRIED
jgi:hypothetical protein